MFWTVDFAYDGQSRRVKKTKSWGSETFYIGDHFEIENGTEVKYIFAGDQRVAKVTAAGTHFFHKDHLGSSNVVTDYANGAEVETSEYMPFGQTREQTGTAISKYKFTDQELDAATGLYNFDARLYDPVIGRFITADSIIPNWYDPQLLNRYGYVRNNPLKYTDPDGHIIQLVVSAIVVTAAITAGAVAITYGIFHYAEPIAADIGTRLGQKIFHKAETGETEDQPSSPALEGDPYHPDKVEERSKEWQDYYGEEGQDTTDSEQEYYPAPKELPGFPDAKPAKQKSQRKRWKDEKGNIYEWDYQHGRVEKYNKRGGHKGEYHPETGDQTKPSDPERKIEP